MSAQLTRSIARGATRLSDDGVEQITLVLGRPGQRVLVRVITTVALVASQLVKQAGAAAAVVPHRVLHALVPGGDAGPKLAQASSPSDERGNPFEGLPKGPAATTGS